MHEEKDPERDSPDAAGSRRCQNDSDGHNLPEEGVQPPRPGPWEAEDLHAQIAHVMSERKRREEREKRHAPRGGWLPGEEALAQDDWPDAAAERPARKEWRITVRLRAHWYEQLAAAAQLYGVRPTTLARMLINRGANAIINSYRRDELGLAPDAEP